MLKTVFACLLLLLTLAAPAAAADFGLTEAEELFGEYRLVRDEAGKLWTRDGWDARPAGSPPAVEYGYLTAAGDKTAAVWLTHGPDGHVSKLTAILDGTVPLRSLERHFPLLVDLIDGGEFYIITGYPRDYLAAVVHQPVGDVLVTFHMAKDKAATRINTHSRMNAFTLTALTAAERGMLKMADKIDNFLQPGLHFSEQLTARRRTDMIVVHHTKIPDLTVASIHDFHLSRGWAGIGYHKVILPDGTVAAGRPEHAVGAHAMGVNRHSLGIVLVGDLDISLPSPAQLTSLVALTAELAKKYGLSADRVVGHRDVFKDTTCPGRMFPWTEFKQALAVRMQAGGK